MKLTEIAILTFVFICGALSIYWGMKANNAPPRTSCAFAEISPDFSHADREKCRQIRGHKL